MLLYAAFLTWLDPWNPTSFHPRSSATMRTMLGLDASAAAQREDPAHKTNKGSNKPMAFEGISSCAQTPMPQTGGGGTQKHLHEISMYIVESLLAC